MHNGEGMSGATYWYLLLTSTGKSLPYPSLSNGKHPWLVTKKWPEWMLWSTWANFVDVFVWLELSRCEVYRWLDMGDIEKVRVWPTFANWAETSGNKPEVLVASISEGWKYEKYKYNIFHIIAPRESGAQMCATYGVACISDCIRFRRKRSNAIKFAVVGFEPANSWL